MSHAVIASSTAASAIFVRINDTLPGNWLSIFLPIGAMNLDATRGGWRTAARQLGAGAAAWSARFSLCAMPYGGDDNAPPDDAVQNNVRSAADHQLADFGLDSG